MKKSLLKLSLAVSAMLASAVVSAQPVDEIAGKYVVVGDAVTEIADGWYVLYNVGRNAYVAQETSDWRMRTDFPTDPSASACAGFVFKVTAVDNGYTIMSGNGNYFDIAQSACSTTDTPVTYTVASHLEGKFYMVNQSNNIVVDGNAAGGTFVGWGSSVPTSSGNSTYEFRQVVFAESEDQVRSAQSAALENLMFKIQGFYGYVQNAANYVSNKKSSQEGSYEALIDGEYTTYFHSAYGTEEGTDAHYLQAFTEVPAGDFRIFTKKRSGNNNNRPINVTVQGNTAADGDFTTITTIESGMPTDAADIAYLSDVINGGENTYLRFVVNATNTNTRFFTYSEFYILPNNETVVEFAEIYNALKNIHPTETDAVGALAARIKTLDAAVQAEIDGTTIDVVVNFPEFCGETLSITFPEVKFGADIASSIPAIAFFTSEGIQEDNSIVSANNNTFTVTGTWSFPFELDKVYRMDLRKSETLGCNNFFYNSVTSMVETRNGTDAAAFVPERLFYLSGAGFTANGTLTVTLHTIGADAAVGVNVAPDNNAHATVNSTPTQFLVVTNSNGTEGVSLQHPDAESHVNDVNGNLGVWANGSASQNDGGSFIRFKALENADFDGLLAGENAEFFIEDVVNTAKASHAQSDVRAVFANYAAYDAAVAQANALIASVSGYTADHFGESLGYFSGSTYETIQSLVAALQETINSKDPNAIFAAIEELNAEIAKVTVNLPQAGRYYRFKGCEGEYYITPTTESGQMAMAETPTDASVFRFDAVDGSDNTFTPVNVTYNVGITGTHSLGGNETYTFIASEGGVAGAFTIKSNYSGSQYVYNHYDQGIVNRNSGYHTRCNWILEEVADPTSIEEIEVANPAVQGIYDLQGRKLSAPVKGINIINGKKVLVK